MKKLLIRCAAPFLASGIAASAFGAATAQDPDVQNPTGQDDWLGFELPSVDGSETVSLEEYRGQKVLLIEFASW